MKSGKIIKPARKRPKNEAKNKPQQPLPTPSTSTEDQMIIDPIDLSDYSTDYESDNSDSLLIDGKKPTDYDWTIKKAKRDRKERTKKPDTMKYALKTTMIDATIQGPVKFQNHLNTIDDQPLTDAIDQIRDYNGGYMILFKTYDYMKKYLLKTTNDKLLTLMPTNERPDDQKPRYFVVARNISDSYTKDDIMSFTPAPTDAIQMKDKQGNMTRKWRLTYNDEETRDNALDNGIKFGLICIRTESYIYADTILQCFKCQKFGHSYTKCVSTNNKCLRCSGDHRSKDCTIRDPKQYKCANCGGNHSSTHHDCEVRKRFVNAKPNRIPYEEIKLLRSAGATKIPESVRQHAKTTQEQPNIWKQRMEQRQQEQQQGKQQHEQQEQQQEKQQQGKQQQGKQQGQKQQQSKQHNQSMGSATKPEDIRTEIIITVISMLTNALPGILQLIPDILAGKTTGLKDKLREILAESSINEL